jgi:hypothetical protein
MDVTIQDFEFWMPTTLVRSRSGQAPEKLKDWRIGGIASTLAKDLDGEIIHQDGIDLGYLNSGWGNFNWNHQSGPDNLLGPIDYVEKCKGGLWTEGYLWKHVAKAQEIYDILRSVPEGDKSPLGFSVQGKVSLRHNGNILKSLVRQVAVTDCPINQQTYADLLKAYEPSFRCLSPASEVCECEACLAKALDPGTQNPPVSGGDVLRTESLESGKTRKRKKRSIKAQTYELGKAAELVMQKRPNLSTEQAVRVARYALVLQKLQQGS